MPYLGNQPTASDTLSVFKYVATASQTTFTGSDAGGATLSYDVGDGSCQVHLNGIRLSDEDITAENGTSVVLAACALGDIVHIQATKAFIPADVVPKAAGGTFDGAVVIGAGATVPSGQTLTIASGATIANSGTATGFADLTAIADGSVGSPSLANSGDTNTGIYWPGADQLGLTTAGAAAMLISASGEITKPLQPAFGVHPASNQTDIALNSGVTIVWGTELFDVGANFASNTFTAPVTGKYSLNFSLYMQDFDTAANYYQANLVTSNRTFYDTVTPGTWSATEEFYHLMISMVADMDASDTVYVSLWQSAGTQQTDIMVTSSFSGALLC